MSEGADLQKNSWSTWGGAGCQGIMDTEEKFSPGLREGERKGKVKAVTVKL